MLQNFHKAGILSQNPASCQVINMLSQHTVSCQVLEAPEIPTSPDSCIPQVVRESTYPVPFGAFSALSALNLGQLSTFEYSLYSAMNYRSNQRSGKTHYLSHRRLSRVLGTSVRYVRGAIASLIEKGFVSIISTAVTGTRYQLKHFLCKRDEVPTDKNGYPCKFSVARGKGSPDERMAFGHISHKSKTLWEYLSFRSDWRTGVTEALSIKLLAKLLKMGKETVTACLRELTEAGLLKRLTPKHIAGIYQLYPKPSGKPRARYRPKSDDAGKKDRDMRVDGDWRLSFNELWRVNVETGDIQFRKSRRFGLWRELTLGVAIPRAIARDFDLCLSVHRQLRQNLGVPDSAQGVPDSAQGVPDSAQGGFEPPPDTSYRRH